MAEEYKSILSDQEHPVVQLVSPHDVPIFLNDNALTFTVVASTANGFRCGGYTEICEALILNIWFVI